MRLRFYVVRLSAALALGVERLPLLLHTSLPPLSARTIVAEFWTRSSTLLFGSQSLVPLEFATPVVDARAPQRTHSSKK
jgi:hypothetical protein